jgi:hypothetical protein
MRKKLDKELRGIVRVCPMNSLKLDVRQVDSDINSAEA